MALAVLEAEAVTTCVVQRLLADTGAGGVAVLVSNRVYRDVAPAGALYPFVIVSWLSAEDLATANGTHVWQNCLVLTKVVDQAASVTAALTIAKRIAVQLDGYGGVTVDGVYITMFRRESMPPQPADFVSGKQYIYQNQVWRTEAAPA